ncbi:molybdate ABC transporter permease subunit, partial [Escherichia coli]
PAESESASVILSASLLLLFSINTLQSRFGRRVVGH